VVDKFDYEEPYTEIKDTIMDLQYLDGLDDEKELSNTVDAQDLFGDEEMGKIKINLFKKSPPPPPGQKKESKLKQVLKKGLNVVNKVNPATVALRAGILAAMKLNLFKIAQRLKWAYLSEADAKKRGIDIAKWQKLVQVRQKLENIFYGAGGNYENLKSAILTGKGNANKEVAGLLGYIPEGSGFEMNERTPLPQLVGQDIYSSEMEGIGDLEGFGELGEPATAATITAASGVLAAIAGLLKSIGNIFPKKEKGSAGFENTESEDGTAIKQGANLPAPVTAPTTETALLTTDADSGTSVQKTDNSQTSQTNDASSASGGEGGGDKPQGFWEKNKKWLKPTLWGIGGLGLLYAGYRMVKGKKEEKKVKPKAENKPVLSGLKSKKKKTQKPAKKKSVALM
jgi:hypothetical protein